MAYEYSEKDVGPGWASLVKPLIERAKAEGIDIRQIKEKFGGLRFYTGPAPESFYNDIDAAEKASMKTCEECGQPGKTRNTDGWMRTRCDACITNLDAF